MKGEVSKLCRFVVDGLERFGVAQERDVFAIGGIEKYPLESVRLLPPVHPSKIICLGYNYREHAEERNREVPSEPIVFFKPPSAIIGPGEPIVLPRASDEIRCEGELGVVIGKVARNVVRKDADEYIYGYVCANDVSAKDIQRRERLWTRAKSFDTFAPIGPFLAVGDIDPDALRIRTKVNGKVYQDTSSELMVFGVHELIEYISGIMTLVPGDVILTGTGANAPAVEDGDVVEVEIEGIGTLENPVIRP